MNPMSQNGRMGFWAPAPPKPLPSPYLRGPALGQREFLESPVVALMTDSVLAGTSAYLAWGLGAVRNKWSTFWWVVTGVATVKALHDMSRL